MEWTSLAWRPGLDPIAVIGRQVGNYVIDGQIGEGGMGIVYRARHPRLPRSVAVKVLRAGPDLDPEMAKRFFNEAQAASALQNDHIVDVLDFGELDGGRPYIVMEWLDGTSLASLLKKERSLPLGRALHIATGICDAIAAAHAAGVIHRDLKPDNVFLIRTQKDPEFVKVLDFGIAKLSNPAASLQTRTGSFMGTPFYMSPEQCRNPKDVDHRSDLYAIGVILYEMLAGRPPFQAEGLGEIIMQHMKEPPRAPRRFVQGLPSAIDRAILRALEKAPEDRFPSAEAFAAALRLEDDVARATAHLMAADTPPEGGTVARKSTLGEAAGETAAPVTAREPSRRVPRGWLSLGTGAAGLAILGTALLVFTGEKAAPPAPVSPAKPPAPALVVPAPPGPGAPTPAASVPAVLPASAPPVSVLVDLSSQPPGARVISNRDGAVLGTTPYRRTLPRSETPLALWIELAGFEAQPLALPVLADVSRTVILAPVRAPATRAPASTTVGEASAVGKRTGGARSGPATAKPRPPAAAEPPPAETIDPLKL